MTTQNSYIFSVFINKMAENNSNFIDYQTHELTREQQDELLDEINNNSTYFGIPLTLIGFLLRYATNYTHMIDDFPEVLQEIITEYLFVESYAIILRYDGIWDRVLGCPIKWLFRRIGVNNVYTFKPVGYIKKTRLNNGPRIISKKQFKKEYVPPIDEKDRYCLVVVTNRPDVVVQAYELDKRYMSNIKFIVHKFEYLYDKLTCIKNDAKIPEYFSSAFLPKRMVKHNIRFRNILEMRNDIDSKEWTKFNEQGYIYWDGNYFINTTILGESKVNLPKILDYFPQHKQNISQLRKKFRDVLF